MSASFVHRPPFEEQFRLRMMLIADTISDIVLDTVVRRSSGAPFQTLWDAVTEAQRVEAIEPPEVDVQGPGVRFEAGLSVFRPIWPVRDDTVRGAWFVFIDGEFNVQINGIQEDRVLN